MGETYATKVLTSPWEPHHITSSSDGAAIDIPDLEAATGFTFPVSAWWVVAWIYIISMGVDTGALLSVTIGSSEPIQFKWSSTDYQFVQGGQSAGGTEARPSNKWFMVIMGSDNHNQIGGLVSTKSLESEKVWSGTISLTSPASLKAPVGVGSFDVKNM